MLPNDVPIKTSLNGQSPFKKVINYPNTIPKLNYYSYPKQMTNSSLSSHFQEKFINYPIHLGLNFYFAPPKNNFYQPQIYSANVKPQEIYCHYNNSENIPTNIMFKNSLAKSGYRLTQEQIAHFKDSYIRHNNINNINNTNNYYSNFNYCPVNNNNNIINNIYPTITKVTNVQILTENESPKVNETKQEIKKENISINNNMNRDLDIKEIKKEEENMNINNNNNKKVIFECSETNGININNKKLLKKKRLRKNNEQLELLTKFYNDNKNWTKKQIKEISEIVGLKENKIYKWLWDKKNKEYMATKFVVKK